MNLKVYIYPTEENSLTESDRFLYYKSFLFKYASDSTIGDLMRGCYQAYQEEFDPLGHNQRFVWKRGDRFVELNEQFDLARNNLWMYSMKMNRCYLICDTIISRETSRIGEK